VFQPKHHITNKILGNIAKIEAAREVIQNAPLVPAWEAKFREEAIVRTVFHGTHIEGNELNFSEAKAVLEGRDITAKQRDVQEVLNYREVIKYIDTLTGKGQGVTEEVLLRIHELTTRKVLPKDQAGSYRKVAVNVTNNKTGEIVFRPPLPNLVQEQVRAFITWLNSPLGKEENAILKSGITHHELVRIHPFVDGNGRSARALTTLVLFLEGYDIKKFFSLEEYYDRNAEDYYSALKSAESGDLTQWLEYFTEGLAIELTRIKQRVQKLSVDLKLKGKLGQVALNERQLKLVEYIEDYGKVSNKEWRGLLSMVSDDTILRDLKDLMKKGLVKKRSATKAAEYFLAK
jgi:Fic family protein